MNFETSKTRRVDRSSYTMATILEPLVNTYEMLGLLTLDSAGKAHIDKFVVANDIDVTYKLIEMAFAFRSSALNVDEFDPIEYTGNFAYYHRLRTTFSPQTVKVAPGLRRSHVHGSKHLMCNWAQYSDIGQVEQMWTIEKECISNLNSVRPSFPRTYTFLQKMHAMPDTPVSNDMHFLCNPNEDTAVNYAAFECPGYQFPFRTFIEYCNVDTFRAFLDQMMSVLVIAHEQCGFVNHNMNMDDILIHYLPRSVYTVCSGMDKNGETSRVVDYPFVASFIGVHAASYVFNEEEHGYIPENLKWYNTPVASVRYFLRLVNSHLSLNDNIKMVEQKIRDIELVYEKISGHNIRYAYQINSTTPNNFKDILPTLFTDVNAPLYWGADQITPLSEYPRIVDNVEDLSSDENVEEYNLRVESSRALWLFSIDEFPIVNSSTLKSVRDRIEYQTDLELNQIRQSLEKDNKPRLYHIYNNIIKQYVRAFDLELANMVKRDELIDEIPWQEAINRSLRRFMKSIVIESGGLFKFVTSGTRVENILETVHNVEYTFD